MRACVCMSARVCVKIHFLKFLEIKQALLEKQKDDILLCEME